MMSKEQKLRNIDKRRSEIILDISKAQNELMELNMQRTNLIMED